MHGNLTTARAGRARESDRQQHNKCSRAAHLQVFHLLLLALAGQLRVLAVALHAGLQHGGASTRSRSGGGQECRKWQTDREAPLVQCTGSRCAGAEPQEAEVHINATPSHHTSSCPWPHLPCPTHQAFLILCGILLAASRRRRNAAACPLRRGSASWAAGAPPRRPCSPVLAFRGGGAGATAAARPLRRAGRRRQRSKVGGRQQRHGAVGAAAAG